MVQGNHVRRLAQGANAWPCVRHLRQRPCLDPYGRPKSRWRLLVSGWIWLYDFHGLRLRAAGVAHRIQPAPHDVAARPRPGVDTGWSYRGPYLPRTMDGGKYSGD